MLCHRIGCKAPATLVLKCVVPNRAGRPTACEGVLGVMMCEEHFAEADIDPEWVRSPAIQMLFAQAIETTAEPDWEAVYLDSVPINSPEHKAFMGLCRVS